MTTPIPTLRDREGHAEEHQSAVRGMFDRIAKTYDLSNRVMSAGLDVTWRKRAVHELASAPRGALLDLCAGTMDGTALLAKLRPESRLVASDFSKEMLEAGRAKVPQAEVVVADALALPFKDAEFAGALCAFGVRNVASPERAIAEVRRVLAPSGVFVTLEFFRPAGLAARVFHEAYAKHLLPAIGGAISGERGAYAYLAKSMDGFLSRHAYEDLLRDAGFKNVRAVDFAFGVASMVRAEVPS